MELKFKTSELVKAIESSWCAETSNNPEKWTKENTSYGQCAVTALVLNDFVGGDIIRCMVKLSDNTKVSHYFNYFQGFYYDLTRKQFDSTVGFDLTNNQTRTKEELLNNESTKQRYELLKQKTLEKLGFIEGESINVIL
jgi:hypothetical protein